MLQDSLKQMLKGNKEFYKIDNQKIVYEYALRNAIDTVASNDKNVNDSKRRTWYWEICSCNKFISRVE